MSQTSQNGALRAAVRKSYNHQETS